MAGLLALALVLAAAPATAQDQGAERTQTELEATPVIGSLNAGSASVYVPAFQAQLTTAGGDPIEGEPLDFEIEGEHACTAVTRDSGYGWCFAPALTPLAIATAGYDALFEGTEDLQPAEDRAPLAVLLHKPVPG